MDGLQDLYHDLILDHNRKPRNRRVMSCPDRRCDGYNPLCGDRVTVYLKLNGDVIEEVSFEGKGCAISTASASLMTDALKGKTIDEAERLFQAFHSVVTTSDHQDQPQAELGKLLVFAGVSKYPARVKCATLVWHTFKSALDQQQQTVSTE